MLNIFIAYNIAKGEDFSVYNNVKEGSNICILQKSSVRFRAANQTIMNFNWQGEFYEGSIKGIVATMAKMYNTLAHGPLAMSA